MYMRVRREVRGLRAIEHWCAALEVVHCMMMGRRGWTEPAREATVGAAPHEEDVSRAEDLYW